MSVKKVLFLDDDNLTQVIDKLSRNLKKNGFTLDYRILELKLPQFKRRNPEDSTKYILDFEAIKEELKQTYFRENFDLVACDYNLANDPHLDGYKILSWLKNIVTGERHALRKAKFVLYSAEADKFATRTNTVEEIRKLIRLNLTEFFRRETMADDLSTLIFKADQTFNFLNSLLSELKNYPSFKFQSVYPKFANKTLQEIANEIDKDSQHGMQFQQNLVELTIAHLIDLNKSEE